MKRLGKALAKRDITLHYRSVHYDAILAPASHAFQHDQIARGMDAGQLTSDIGINTLSDALVITNAKVQAKVFDLVDREYMALRSDTPVLIGHSLGCKVLLDWAASRQLAPIKELVTLACNAALWYLGDDFPVPRQIAGGGKWINVADKDDMLGAAMEGVAPGSAMDLEVPLGGWFSRTGAVHTKYWNDARLWEKTLPGLLAL